MGTIKTPSTDTKENSLADALFSKTRKLILSLLFTHADSEFHNREIIRQVATGGGAIERELENLVDAGIILREKRGRQVHYQANPKSPIFDDLRSLFAKTCGVADVIADSLKPLWGKIKLAFIFGSIAKGNEDSMSDIDLLIVGNVSLRELSGLLRDACFTLKRVINPHVISSSEYRERLKKEDDFFARITHEKKIIIKGDLDEFTGLA